MRIAIRVVLIVLAFLFVAIVSLPFLVSANQFKPMIEANLTKALGRQVSIGDLKLSILSGGVAADDLAIADDPAFSHAPFVRAKSLKLGVELWPLIVSRKLIVRSLVIDQPEVSMLQSASGDWNFSSMGSAPAHAAEGPRIILVSAAPAAAPGSSSSGNLDLSVELLKITGGSFSMGKTGGHEKPLALTEVNIQVQNLSSETAFPFSFSAKVAGGGAIKLDGKAGPIDAGDVILTPLEIALDVTGLDLAATPAASQSPGLAGLISFHGDAKSAAGRVTIDAKLKAEHLKLAKDGKPAKPPMEFDFALAHDLKKHSGALERGDLRVGTALAHLTGTYEEKGETDFLDMKFSGPQMPVQELAELLPPMGMELPSGSSLQGGTATANFTVNGPADKLVTAGSVGLNKTRLAGFDLGSKLSTIEAMVGMKGGPNTDIDTLAADLRMAPEGITVSNLHFLAPAIGELSGAGAISPAQALDFKMSATLHTSGTAAILSKAAVPFLIGGTEQNPIFKPDVKGLVANEAKSLKPNAVKAAGGLLNNLLGGKKKK